MDEGALKVSVVDFMVRDKASSSQRRLGSSVELDAKLDPGLRQGDAQIVDSLVWAQDVLLLYGLTDFQSVQLINLSENATYKVSAGSKNFALRLHRPNSHSKTEILSELAWSQDLRADNVILTPAVIAAKDGSTIQTVGDRFAVLFAWEDGNEPLISEPLEKHFITLGEQTARMHAHSRAWARPAWFTRKIWNFETALGEAKPHWGLWKNGVGFDEKALELFTRTVAVVEKKLESYGMGHERFGLVHADLRLANLLIDGERVKVLDFDDCGFSWFMYDLAAALSFHEHEPHVPELIAAWKRGYTRVGALSAEDEGIIPTLIMFRRLLLVAWVGSHQDAPFAFGLGAEFTAQTALLCEAYLAQN